MRPQPASDSSALHDVQGQLQASVRDDQALQRLITKVSTPSIASALPHSPRSVQIGLLMRLPAELACVVLLDLDQALQQVLVGALPEQGLVRILRAAEPDDAADLVGYFSAEEAARLLHQLSDDERVRITNLLRYPEDSAGGLMDPDVVKVRDSLTIAEAMVDIRNYVSSVKLDDFFSIFVLDRTRRLVGAVSASKMLLASPDQVVRDIMETDVITVDPQMDQEAVAQLVHQHNLITVPVVDAQGRLLGRITVDDVVDVIRAEFSEDIGRLSGTGDESVVEPSLLHALKLRAPWLLLALGGQFAVATFMSTQEQLLRTVTQLTFFIPLIMAMAGNAGIQSSTLVIRGLATGDILLTHFFVRVLRETLIASALGMLFCVILILGSTWLTGEWKIGVTVGLSTVLTLLIAAAFGTSMPMLLKRLEIDPALATGPFLTTANDILALLVYIWMARLLVF